MPKQTVCLRRDDGKFLKWTPTTLTREGRDERFLEEVIADVPDLLGLESLRTGIHGPLIPFRQVRFKTPQGRDVRPDVVILTASGHVVVVEVKLSDNAELRDRRVIAQVVDYATSFAALKPEELLPLFDTTGDPARSWPVLIERLFPNAEDTNELADLLLHRFKDELQLVIACDKEPAGLRDVVEGISRQEALSFGFSVVELRPYVCETRKGEYLFFQNTVIETKTVVVSKTNVTVAVMEGAPRPEIIVRSEVVNAQDVEETIKKVRRRGPGAAEPTVVDEATDRLEALLADLIADGRSPVPECQSGHKIKCDFKSDTAGEVYLQVNYFDLAPGGKNLKNKVGKVRVRFLTTPRSGEPSSDRKARSQALKRMLADESGPFTSAVGTTVETVNPTHGVGWMFPSSVVPQPWTPEILADWTAGVFRHFLQRLPLKAGIGVDIEEAGIDEEDEN